jgi:acyl transferase domain-containing protein
MEPMLEDFRRIAETVKCNAPRIPLISNISGQMIAPQCVPHGATLPPPDRDWEQIMEDAGTLYTHGVNLDWNAFDKYHSRRRVGLPTYPFQRDRYSLDSPTPSPERNRTLDISLPAGEERLQTAAQKGASLRAEWSTSPEQGGFGVVRLLDEHNNVIVEIAGGPQKRRSELLHTAPLRSG